MIEKIGIAIQASLVMRTTLRDWLVSDFWDTSGSGLTQSVPVRCRLGADVMWDQLQIGLRPRECNSPSAIGFITWLHIALATDDRSVSKTRLITVFNAVPVRFRVGADSWAVSQWMLWMRAPGANWFVTCARPMLALALWLHYNLPRWLPFSAEMLE